MNIADNSGCALKRRRFMALAAAAAFAPWGASAKSPEMTIWKSPTCGCCGKWVDHLRQSGFSPVINEMDQPGLDAVKDELTVPVELRSCHTATVGGYVIEGHVPADDIRLLLSYAPKVTGLAVPGMPIGSPGMEIGAEVEPYATYAFSGSGDIQIFVRHG